MDETSKSRPGERVTDLTVFNLGLFGMRGTKQTITFVTTRNAHALGKHDKSIEPVTTASATVNKENGHIGNVSQISYWCGYVGCFARILIISICVSFER